MSLTESTEGEGRMQSVSHRAAKTQRGAAQIFSAFVSKSSGRAVQGGEYHQSFHEHCGLAFARFAKACVANCFSVTSVCSVRAIKAGRGGV